MPIPLTVMLTALGIYAIVGVIVGIALVCCGVTRIDSAAHESRWSFRLLILPGVAALWPFMLTRWIAAVRGRTHVYAPPDGHIRRLRFTHALIWCLLGPALIVGLVLVVANRPTPSSSVIAAPPETHR